MHYIVYQTTNLINGKIYIGQHQTSDLNDGYLGSGKHLRRAIKKYGIENFQREILYQFDNLEDMSAKEAEIVTEDFCNRDDTYNICPGGKGGFGYINSNGLTNYIGFSKENQVKGHKAQKNLRQNDETWVLNFNKSVQKGLKTRYISFEHQWTGKRHSEETKLKMSKPKNQGSLNSQFGSMWITNGTENKKIKKLDQIPEGWYKGRFLLNRSINEQDN